MNNEMIEFGSIEYYALIELRDTLNERHYQNLGLEHLDRLRFEVTQKIEQIKNNHKNGKESNK